MLLKVIDTFIAIPIKNTKHVLLRSGKHNAKNSWGITRGLE